jgi:hypothetical protein
MFGCKSIAYLNYYIRVRASIEVNKPLIQFASTLSVGVNRLLLQVKYEKIGYFCDVCGIMWHDLEACGDGVHPPGMWMTAQRIAHIGCLFIEL